MNQAAQLADRFEQALLKGKWVTNTNCRELLEDVTFKEAITSYKGLNSIASLVFHINYYIEGVTAVFNGKELTIRDSYSFKMPPLEKKDDWIVLRDQLITNAHYFSSCLAKLSDEQLEATFVKKEYGNYSRNMNGMIEHSYYHLGQIVLIKKLLRS